MITFAVKKGMGLIGVLMFLVMIGFFWTLFYIVINQIYVNFLPTLTTDTNTLNFFNSCLVLIWHFLPFGFAISMLIWAIIQSQNPFNQFVIGGIWLTIIFSWFIFSMAYVTLDTWMMTTMPAMLPMAADYQNFYTNFILVSWRGVPWALALCLMVFGCFIAPAYFERGGGTYASGGAGW